MSTLYETDSYEWARLNAELIRAGRIDEADLEHIAEELEALGVSERRELGNRLKVLIQHLLKCRLRAENMSSSWRSTINVQRRSIQRLFRRAPSLRRELQAEIDDVYPDAAADATDEMLLDRNPFPTACPFTAEQILDTSFFPRS